MSNEKFKKGLNEKQLKAFTKVEEYICNVTEETNLEDWGLWIAKVLQASHYKLIGFAWNAGKAKFNEYRPKNAKLNDRARSLTLELFLARK